MPHSCGGLCHTSCAAGGLTANDSLGTYLHDHLAGAAYAIDLVEFMRDCHQDDDLGPFAAEILIEIKKDGDTLRGIAERVGASGSTLKEAASWVGEKISRFKLGHHGGNGLATFEALELLAIGILGKRAHWRRWLLVIRVWQALILMCWPIARRNSMTRSNSVVSWRR